ncbi:hypothetical protein A8709_05695 [Paenibacillus pectinilyticus]|uniref:HYR domain-containing protein n=1 Tax=Paenibacillus pectinilyticus TaxID=512399 RepID=A0A1C0ZSW7_9BACL|nr:hypothetical protein [Paenibacillus pectinilyticus]OCT11175.1 hypothetical protein A8709_05695 [Paenibacillus pectinilyticus]
MNERLRKGISSWLAGCLLFTTLLANVMTGTASAAVSTNTNYLDTYIYGAKVVNHKDMPSWTSSYDSAELNFFSVFTRVAYPCGAPQLPGISFSMEGDDYDCDDREFTDKDINHVDGFFRGYINVSQIPELKRIAEGGTAKFLVKAGKLDSTSDHGAYIKAFTNGNERWYAHSTSSEPDLLNANSGWLDFGPNDTILIQTETNGSGTEVDDIRIYFADIDLPTIKDYTFTSDGTERENTVIHQQELFLRKDQKLALSYNFNEAVKASAPVMAAKLTSHYLFTNPAGTGLPASGENQSMKLSLTANELKDYTKALPYVYTASDFHHTGNLPISDGGELETHRLNDESLWEKIDASEFHDTAGNPLKLDGFTKASTTSSTLLAGKTINPFDYTSGQGFRVIIDAVPPKYSSVANGIQPDIVTGSTLNKGDVIDFKVQLTEDAIVKDGLPVGGLYLLFNNGMKAYYQDGENSSIWTFRAYVTQDDVDVSLLKAIRLTHNLKPGNTDKGVIQDYAGNLLMDAANTSKSTNSDPSQTVANTKIDWAKLSIDNTPPSFSYIYENGGATDTSYGKVGKVTIDANDPAITTPSLDPDEAGAVRPSRGIYHPLNLTGSSNESSPGVGLVYYMWSQSPENPLAGKEADQFAAVKRYSLTGLQPSEGLYPGELPDVSLMVVNNKTNLLMPPDEAFTPANSGSWYLHTWTADMTWDTARELMQVDKMKKFKLSNASQYNGWISEYKAQHAGSSDTDAQTYAEGKALEAVGQYKNLSLWTPDDFKHDDSNWVYSSATILLDNKAPQVSAHISGGNNTAEVKASVQASDEHSGIDSSKLLYQWVKVGEQPQEISWKVVPANGTITTLNNLNLDVNGNENGEYVLYLRAVDKAGNQTETNMDEHVVVNNTVNIHASFDTDDMNTYVRSHEIAFAINGISVAEAVYAFSPSAAVPDASAFKAFISPEVDPAADLGESSVTNAVYIVGKDTSLNGTQYLHIRIKSQTDDKLYYFSQTYNFDNKAPVVYFSKTEVGYAKPSHSVAVVATELFSPEGMTTKYQWLPTAAVPPDESSAIWKILPEDGNVTVDNSNLAPGEVTDYTLYVYATDGAGNVAITHTGAFKLVREENTPIEVLKSDLVYLDGNETDGYQAIVKTELKNVAKDGYSYAISTDDGANWHPWLPYTNFIKVDVPSGQAGQLKLKVKFKSATGTISDAVDIDTRGYSSSDEPIYGLASQDTLRPVAGNALLTITVKPGIKVMPATLTENPVLPVRTKGNTFSISQNGVYTFDLTDVTDVTRHDKLLIVVNNVDNTPPTGTIEKSVIGPTTSNVRVKLSTSEDVRITNNEGRSSYIFTENGTFTFDFEDEAGNQGSATVVVDNIDRSQPTAHIVQSYSYGSHGEKTFKTVKNAQNQVVMAQGVTLSVEKINVSDKDFKIIRAPKQTTLYANGSGEFTIADGLGNTTVLEETVTQIVTKLPDPERIDYEFVDENGNLLTQDRIVTIDGKTYAKGKMRVTMHGHVDAPNQVFRGTVPVPDGASYSNLISDADGHYDYAMTYSTNGEMRVALTDLLGNTTISLIKVEGLDNTAPTIQLKSPFIAIAQNKANFNPLVDLGGYTVSDNLSAASNLKVTVEQLDLSKLGRQKVVYTVTDEVGNTATIKQDVVVLSSAGLLIVGNDQVLSASSSESILFNRNDITFTISGYNLMQVNGESAVNERGTFDILYHSGLYREGQMKYIAQKITMDQLLNNKFTVVFPETGWYTIIVRTQEREREFATFFIGKINK